jgi:hypothetical protein
MSFLPPTLLCGCAAVLGVWAEWPWIAIAGLALVTVEVASAARRKTIARWESLILWGATLLTVAAVLLAKRKDWNLTHATIGLLTAAGILLGANSLSGLSIRHVWRVLGVIWGFAVAFIWLGFSYQQNLAGAFYVGLVLNVILLILCKKLFRLPFVAVQIVNTLLLLLIGLPIADWVVRPRDRAEPNLDPAKKYYSYEFARRDPGGYASWQASYGRQIGVLWRHLFIGGSPYDDPPWHFRTNSHGKLFQSSIAINSRGFRGKEIPEPKGDTYRIVALGESTTFGITMRADDKPWPELLEQMIRERLKPGRPVEVINAGVPGYNLKLNLDRFSRDILPLHPDMIISYHGYNGFSLIGEALPQSGFHSPPAYRQRPLKLLADCEYQLKLGSFKRQAARLNAFAPSVTKPMETAYAKAYEQLIEVAATNNIRLVLGNYSMAVNAASDRDVAEFYRPLYPSVFWDIKANEIHSFIVAEVARRHPEIGFVDTHPELDGRHEKFFDLMHFETSGERQLAETFFARMRPILEDALAPAHRTDP